MMAVLACCVARSLYMTFKWKIHNSLWSMCTILWMGCTTTDFVHLWRWIPDNVSVSLIRVPPVGQTQVYRHAILSLQKSTFVFFHLFFLVCYCTRQLYCHPRTVQAYSCWGTWIPLRTQCWFWYWFFLTLVFSYVQKTCILTLVRNSPMCVWTYWLTFVLQGILAKAWILWSSRRLRATFKILCKSFFSRAILFAAKICSVLITAFPITALNINR